MHILRSVLFFRYIIKVRCIDVIYMLCSSESSRQHCGHCVIVVKDVTLQDMGKDWWQAKLKCNIVQNVCIIVRMYCKSLSFDRHENVQMGDWQTRLIKISHKLDYEPAWFGHKTSVYETTYRTIISIVLCYFLLGFPKSLRSVVAQPSHTKHSTAMQCGLRYQFTHCLYIDVGCASHKCLQLMRTGHTLCVQ